MDRQAQKEPTRMEWDAANPRPRSDRETLYHSVKVQVLASTTTLATNMSIILDHNRCQTLLRTKSVNCHILSNFHTLFPYQMYIMINYITKIKITSFLRTGSNTGYKTLHIQSTHMRALSWLLSDNGSFSEGCCHHVVCKTGHWFCLPHQNIQCFAVLMHHVQLPQGGGKRYITRPQQRVWYITQQSQEEGALSKQW